MVEQRYWLLLLICLTSVSCSSSRFISPISESFSIMIAEQADVAGFQNGQLDSLFPEYSSNRKWVNNRRTFIAYQKQGEVWVDLLDSQKATIKINGHPITLRSQSSGKKQLKIDISCYTRDGVNQLEITDVYPYEQQIRVLIPYPVLTESTPEAVGFSRRKLNELDQLINDEIEQGFPGAVLVIVKNGKVIKETAYGYASLYDKEGNRLTAPESMQKNTVFDLASNTKMYATNYALMKLVSEGKLDVSKPIQFYIPDYQGDGREIRLVEDLLYHIAGYPPEVHFFRPDNRHGADFYSMNKAHTTELIIKQVPFDKGRAEQAVYSDIDYMLLGILVEKISGLPLDEYVEQVLYQSLGLSRTKFNPLRKGIPLSDIAATELLGNSRGGRIHFPLNREDVIRGEVHDEKAFYSLDGVAGHAGLFSTAREVAALTLLVQHGGYGWTHSFSPAVIQQFVRPSVYDHRFGLGWRTSVQGDLNWHFGPYSSPYAYGHTGWTGTATLIDPYYNLAVVLLTNKKHSPIKEDGKAYYFSGDKFETGMYGSIMSKIYEAMLQH